MSGRLRVGISWGMDGHSISNGQYRYAVDLFRSLASLDSDAEFVVFGTKAEPPSEIADLFHARSQWTWRHHRRWPWRSGHYVTRVTHGLGLLGHGLDVLHCIDSPIPFAAPCPILWTLYDILPEVLPEERAWRETKDWQRYRHAARTRVAHHLAISQATADDAIRHWNIDPQRITVTHLGTRFPPTGFEDLEVGSRLARFKLPVNQPFLCAAYNLYPRKNLVSLLAAMRILKAEELDIRLALFGKTGFSPAREAWFDRVVADGDLTNDVVRIGFVDDLELADLYRSALAFVYPSLHEGFGLPLLEAMSVGACVVARRASSMREVVEDGGVLVETAAPEALAEAIRRVLRDPHERKQIGERAIRRAGSFSLARLAEQTLNAYEQTAAGQKATVASRFRKRKENSLHGPP